MTRPPPGRHRQVRGEPSLLGPVLATTAVVLVAVALVCLLIPPLRPPAPARLDVRPPVPMPGPSYLPAPVSGVAR